MESGGSDRKRMFSESSNIMGEEINPLELDSSIADRRRRRENTDSDKFHEYMAIEEAKRQKKMAQKSQERGWYAVENILGHRIAKYKKREILEL